MIITIGNTKGGVGKTTISVNLAVEAAKNGKRVLLVDTDPQGSSVAFMAERESQDIKIKSIVSKELHKKINSFVPDFDFIIIDAGGRDNKIYRSSVAACKIFLLPVQPSQFDIWAAEDAVNVFKEIQPLNGMSGYFLLNMVQENTRVSKEAQEALEEYKDFLPLLDTCLHNRVAYKTCISYGKSVTEYEPKGKASEEIKNLYNIIQGMK